MTSARAPRSEAHAASCWSRIGASAGTRRRLIRRYRLARLRLEDRMVPGAERFDHLKRSHD